MRTKTKVVIGFAFGVVTGIACTAKYFKDKYQKFADAQIADVKSVYSYKKESETEESTDDEEDAPVENESAETEDSGDKTPAEIAKLNYTKPSFTDYTTYFDLAKRTVIFVNPRKQTRNMRKRLNSSMSVS